MFALESVEEVNACIRSPSWMTGPTALPATTDNQAVAAWLSVRT